VAGRRVVAGPGVAGPKSWRSGCELAALELEQLGIEVTQVGQELAGELVAGLGDGPGRRDLPEGPGRPGRR